MSFDDEVLVVEVQGVVRMLRAWYRRGEVFRAAARHSPTKPGKPTLWRNADAEVLVFSPFLTRAERRAVKVGPGTRQLSVAGWLQELEGDPIPDALDLRLHEVKWHVIDGGRDAAGRTGLASNDAGRRAATTSAGERRAAVEAIKARYTTVRFVRGKGS